MEYNQEMLILLTEGVEWEESIIRRVEGGMRVLVQNSGLSQNSQDILFPMLKKIDAESKEHESTLNKWRAVFRGAGK